MLLPLVLFLFNIACSGQQGFFYTVNGKVDAKNLGFALPHEHVMSNFGADIENTADYDEEALVQQVVPYLKKLKSSGVNTIFDCTTAYFGRNVELLKRISNESGVHIITNTGFYGAANDRYIPDMAYTVSVEDLASLWISEFDNDIAGTKIRPGFIKLAFDEGPPSKIDLKLFEAGILTHLKTGLTLAVHTGDNEEAVRQQFDMLTKHKVSPSAWIWVHAHKVQEENLLVEAAKKGAWISLDGVNSSNLTSYANRLERFRRANLLHRVLLSHDGNSFPRGGKIREYHALPELLVPKLLELGYSKKEIRQLTIENPKNAFLIRKRTP